MTDIVISEFMDQAAVDMLAKAHDVLYDPTLVERPEQMSGALHDCRALIVRNRTQVTGALLDAAPNLKVVGRLGVGLDNIDMEACERRAIAVCPARGANDLSVAEYVITAALLLLRCAWFANQQMIAGQWPRNRLMGRELSGKCLGLIGYGAIARETALRAQALGMQTIACDPYLPEQHADWGSTRKVELEQVLAEADVVSLHIPLTGETSNLIDAAALSKMKPGAILVNAARGGIVDEEALVEALKNGRIGGAALDVFNKEPLDEMDGAKFRDVPNLLLTPHIGGVTQESNLRVSRVTAENVLRYL